MFKKTKFNQADVTRDPKIPEKIKKDDYDSFYEEDEAFDDSLEDFSRDQYYDLYQVEDVDHHFLLTFRDAR